MLAIFITSCTYVGFGIICGATVLRAATGNIDDLYNGTLANCTDGKCDWGLQNSFQVNYWPRSPKLPCYLKWLASNSTTLI